MIFGKTSRVEIKILVALVFLGIAACSYQLLLRQPDTFVEQPIVERTVSPGGNTSEKCAEVAPYTYVQEFKHKQMILHSQVPMRPEFFNLKDTERLAGFVLLEWEKKFDISVAQSEAYMTKVRNLHLVLTSSKEEFDRMVDAHYPDLATVTAIIVPNSGLCFKPLRSPEEYTIFLTPKGYDMTMTNEPGRTIIHELTHLASKSFDGTTNSKHDNKKLWRRHSEEQSVVMLAQKQYFNYLLNKNKGWRWNWL